MTQARATRKTWTLHSHCRQVYRQRISPRNLLLWPLPHLSKTSSQQPLRKHNELPERNTKKNYKHHPQTSTRDTSNPGRTTARHQISPGGYPHTSTAESICSNNKQRSSNGSGTSEIKNVPKRKRNDMRNSYNNKKQHEWPRNQRLELPRLRLQTNKLKRMLSYRPSFCTSRSPSWKRPALRDWKRPAQRRHQQPTLSPHPHLHRTHLRTSNGTLHHPCSHLKGSNTSWTSALSHLNSFSTGASWTPHSSRKPSTERATVS